MLTVIEDLAAFAALKFSSTSSVINLGGGDNLANREAETERANPASTFVYECWATAMIRSCEWEMFYG